MQRDIDSFLKELSELTQKYGIVIEGCGCCGSPYLIDIDIPYELNGQQCEDLSWKDDHYELNTIYDTPEDYKEGCE